MVPLGLLLFTGIALVWDIIQICKTQKSFAIKAMAFEIIFFCVMGFLFTINTIRFLRGGVHLLFERETNKVQITGVIERTGEIDYYSGAKYGIEQNHGSGETITIDGIEYFLVTYGELKEGDRVIAEVLPKSRFVLFINKTE